ncbi:S-adenosyl-L-methionine-dependent methyltransferase [Clathrospora elynae]|uniref:S-adenosyl-L-methionine-dependent methyltransferase n=1 Tax=Clathrospora elynae TaxID=706981 RepID=A0A6A5SER6_9PLEO|nr:S-adenosyl-L-methionine-dependent methyltransferase [Clathrospora elynae]
MTASASDRLRLDKLRPLSSATDLTDFTHSTLEADSDPQSDEFPDFAETQSLTPSIYDYVKKYGRTYHRYMAGALFRQRNYFAPLKKPKRMLDIGCGTGIWCVEMAKEFPRARVEGIDLSPIQPHDTPENIDFFIDDITRLEWWRCAQPYDYIHTRMSLGIFEDFREIIQKGYNNLDPGGWMESQEIYSKVYCNDGTMPATWELLEWTKTEDSAAMRLGRPLRIANKLKTWYEQAGFVDVHEDIFAIPINAWARDARDKLLGKFFHWNMLQGVHAWSVEYFVTALGWTPAEVEVYLAGLRNAIGDKSVHAYYKVWVVWGRKPFPDEPQSTVPKPSHWPQEPASAPGDDDDATTVV